jgi:hypothetical protein
LVYRLVIFITMSEHSTYRCDRCDYSTCRKYNYLKHIKTDKHHCYLVMHRNVRFSVHPIRTLHPFHPSHPTNQGIVVRTVIESIWRNEAFGGIQNNVYHL